MKKYHLYLWIIALVGLMTACSQDEAAGPQNEASNRVRIGAAVDQALQTRAASVTIPEGHKLRYVLEVWNTAESAACIYREEKTATGADAVAFDFTLSEAGNYNALLWADFVLSSETGTPATYPINYTHYADLHYTTDGDDGLKKVALTKTEVAYVLNDDARDAFFACTTIEKGTGAFEKEVELTRPFGQINVIEKNTELLTNVESITLDYRVPDNFNVATGVPSTTMAMVKPTVSSLPTATAVRKANLFYDFIFAPATGQTTLGEIALKFESNNAHITLPEYTIPGNMPVVRNKRTTISGSILKANSDAAKLTVTVSDGWTETDEEYDTDVLVWNGTSTKQPADYTSTPGEVTINTAAELAWLAKQSTDFAGYTFELTANIDLNNQEWTPIGSGLYPFMGTFDGRGHTVSNMKCPNSMYGGLFGLIGNATVQNVTVSGSVSYHVTSATYSGFLGGIVGYAINCTITDCTNKCTISATGGDYEIYAGGIAGKVVANSGSTSKLTGNINTGAVSTNGYKISYAGGIIGVAEAENNTSIILSENTYSGDTPAGVCIGRCFFSSANGGSITIDETPATDKQPFPVPEP